LKTTRQLGGFLFCSRKGENWAKMDTIWDQIGIKWDQAFGPRRPAFAYPSLLAPGRSLRPRPASALPSAHLAPNLLPFALGAPSATQPPALARRIGQDRSIGRDDRRTPRTRMAAQGRWGVILGRVWVAGCRGRSSAGQAGKLAPPVA